MKRRDFIGQALGLVTAAAANAQTPSAPGPGSRPNIVFVLADEVGIGNLSCYGADNFRTPNIDLLARGGTRFTHSYTAPLSGLSRALIQTGRYAFRTGATNQDASASINPSLEPVLAKVLQSAGYVSAAVGAWGFASAPPEFGFDEFLTTGAAGVYRNTRDQAKSYLLNGEVRSLGNREYMPDLMDVFLADFMARHRAEPFFAFYSLAQMHGDFFPTPDSKPDSRDFYTDNIAYMDKLVGSLVAALDRLNLRQNTLIVFSADSGTGGIYAGESTVRGLRVAGAKGSMLEGGSLVPLIVNWPGVTPAGNVAAELIDSTDFLPTFAEVAGAKLPAVATIDGRSFSPLLYGRRGAQRDWVYVQLGASWYVREGMWKLNRAGQLFDMNHAPFGEAVVADDSKEAAAIAARQRLQAELDKLNPAGGIADEGDGTGRHRGRIPHTKKKPSP
jgi:arylsulfatase A